MIGTGDKIPDVKLFKATPDGPNDVSIGDYLSGKKTVLFAVPGAFTPTCSARHLPGFVEKANDLAGKGVDQIACLSVNDPFVMKAWAESTGAMGKIDMLCDGNAALTEQLGLEMDGSGFGLGKRSQRYAMIVDDGKVTELFVEEPGAFEVSSAEHVLSKL